MWVRETTVEVACSPQGVFPRFIKKEYKHTKNQELGPTAAAYYIDWINYLWAESQGLENKKSQVYKLGLIQGIDILYKTPLGDIAMKISNLILKYLIFELIPQYVYLTKMIQLKHVVLNLNYCLFTYKLDFMYLTKRRLSTAKKTK